MDGPSPHLSWDELACHDRLHTPYPIDWRETRAVKVGQAFEAIREACGNRPITVQSGYRTVEHNALVGGVRNSQHLEGRALDLLPPVPMTVSEFCDRIMELAPATPIRFVMRYSWGVHVDCRPSEVVRFATSTRLPG